MKKHSVLCKETSHLANIAEFYRHSGATITLVTGVWDMLHSGHIRYLKDAALYGDVLFVGIDSDELVRSTKGPNRPVINEHERSELISVLEMVDVAFVFSDFSTVMQSVKPHSLIVSPTTEDRSAILGDRMDLAKLHSSTVITISSRSKTHTTDLISSILERFGSK